MNIRICAPVVGRTEKEFLHHLAEVQKISDLIELRVDSIGSVSLDFLRTLKKSLTKSAIFTCRSVRDRGGFTGTEAERVAILQRAIELFPFVDLELETIETHDFSCGKDAKIIVSYHNFLETPSYWDMQKIIFRMNQCKPDILKIATHVHEEYELTKLYRLLTNKPHSEERIVIGMGQAGRMSRIVAPLLGSYLTYASTEWGGSAPGQIEIRELKKMYYSLSFRT